MCRCYLCLQIDKLKLTRNELFAKKRQKKAIASLGKDWICCLQIISSTKEQLLPLINNSLLRVWKQLGNKHNTIKDVLLASFWPWRMWFNIPSFWHWKIKKRPAVCGLHEWLKVNNWFTIFAADLVGNHAKCELPNCFSLSKCSGFGMINIFTQIFISLMASSFACCAKPSPLFSTFSFTGKISDPFFIHKKEGGEVKSLDSFWYTKIFTSLNKPSSWSMSPSKSFLLVKTASWYLTLVLCVGASQVRFCELSAVCVHLSLAASQGVFNRDALQTSSVQMQK